MKNIIIIVAAAVVMTACDKSKPQVDEIARQQDVIDSMKMQSELQLTRQRIIDSVNLISAQNQVILNPIGSDNTPVPTVRPTKPTRPNTSASVPPKGNGTGGTVAVPTDNTAVSPGTVAATTPTVEEKKGMSGKTKGAIIGAAAGVITGAAAGAIINKDNPLQGGIIGGVIGGAVGSGVGYGGGSAADKKKAKQDSINKANAAKNP
ncbi:MAG: hypothetical protein V4677_07460 [Bacteroidota bacterium]